MKSMCANSKITTPVPCSLPNPLQLIFNSPEDVLFSLPAVTNRSNTPPVDMTITILHHFSETRNGRGMQGTPATLETVFYSECTAFNLSGFTVTAQIKDFK